MAFGGWRSRSRSRSIRGVGTIMEPGASKRVPQERIGWVKQVPCAVLWRKDPKVGRSAAKAGRYW